MRETFTSASTWGTVRASHRYEMAQRERREGVYILQYSTKTKILIVQRRCPTGSWEFSADLRSDFMAGA